MHTENNSITEINANKKRRPILRQLFKLGKYILVIIVLNMCGITHILGQTQQFSYTQYMDNLTPLNPAWSLMDQAGSLSLLGRKEWVGVNGAPTTFLLNGNVPLNNINASTGLIVMTDQFAIEHQTEVNAYFAKSIQVSPEGYLAVSLNAGLRNYVANYSQLDPTDPQFSNDIRQTRPNVGFGVLYYTDKYYIGLSVPELTVTSLGTASVQNRFNFVNHYYMAAALLTELADDIMFKPATLLSYASGTPFTANISGTFYLKETLGLGVNYRTDKQAAAIISVNVDVFHVGYSYQFGTSGNNLGGVSIPTHEVNLSYRFGRRSVIKRFL